MARSRSHKRGGSGSPINSSNITTMDDGKGAGRSGTVQPASEQVESKMHGGRRSRRRHHKRKSHRGGNMFATAVLPFGLFGLQKYFQKTRGGRRAHRSSKRTVKR